MERTIIAARNATGAALTLGEVVRVSANSQVVKAQADAPANLQGAVGIVFSQLPVGAGSGLTAVVNGTTSVLLESGLVAPAPAAGQTLYVSPTVPGRATNVKPVVNAKTVGIILDAAEYVLRRLVETTLQVN